MNFLIPMMGKGNRFVVEGYSNPKPLINFNGEPIILHVIKAIPKEARTITCVVSKELIASGIGVVLSYLYDPRIRVVCLPEDTMGAAHTALLACDYLPPEQPVCIIDCDIIPDTSVLQAWMDCCEDTVFYHIDEARSGLFSYLVLGHNGHLTSIVEKEPISDKACSGIYAFSYAKGLKKYSEIVVERGIKTKGEFYMSQVINEALGDMVFTGVPSGNYHNLGTPAQIKIAYKQMYHAAKRFCFDVDATILGAPVERGDYANCTPVQRNIDYLNNLYALGHYIILNSARGFLSGTPEEVSRPLMEIRLKQLGVNYHELHFNKPYADLYFDDKAVNVNVPDIEKATGIYVSLDGEARAFNNVSVKNDRVLKMGECVKHEAYFYKNLPISLQQYFPRIYKISEDCIEMEKIDGVSYSTLYLEGKLGQEDVRELLDVLRRIHSWPGENLEAQPKLLYSYKSWERYNANESFYKQFEDVSEITSKLKQPDTIECKIMHGDPVFSNVFKTKDGVKLIDPRGNIDGKSTIYGDPLYDVAKVIQSLIGYDHALAGKELDNKYRDKLLACTLWSQEAIQDRLKHLLFSLLPLHKEDMARCQRFWNLLKSL